MKRGLSTRVELQTAAQGLPTAPVLLPPSPSCERCVCGRSSYSCQGKGVQKQPNQTGSVTRGFFARGVHGCLLSVFSFASAAAISSHDGSRQTRSAPSLLRVPRTFPFG